jgi:hypothetical protein
MTNRPEVEQAAALILSARRYIPMGEPHLTAAAAVLDAAGVWAPGDVAERPALPPVEFALIGRFCANNRPRTLYRIVIDGREIGTAAQYDYRPSAPWSLTMPSHCANLAHASRADVIASVHRILTTGQIWES